MLKIVFLGRPNVGKSSLFNILLAQSCAVVDDTAGTTRDYLERVWSTPKGEYLLIDTAGIGLENVSSLSQAGEALSYEISQQADILFLVVDGLAGVQLEDVELARKIHRWKKQAFVLVNKIDDQIHEHRVNQFRVLGLPLLAVSASHKLGLEELLAQLPKSTYSKNFLRPIYMAILGRPNVGKSTLINTLLGNNRCITDSTAGTTRDANFLSYEALGQPWVLIDTAGRREKRNMQESVEVKAQDKSIKALQQADLLVLVLDVQQGITAYEKRILFEIEQERRSVILLLNKWDCVQDIRMEHTMKGLQMQEPFLQHASMLCISAKTGRNLDKIMPLALETWNKIHRRIPTTELNRWIEYAMELHGPAAIKGKRLKIYYVVQKTVAPLCFLMFVNKAALVTASYRRYLLRELRAYFGLEGVFIALQFKSKKQQKDED